MLTRRNFDPVVPFGGLDDGFRLLGETSRLFDELERSFWGPSFARIGSTMTPQVDLVDADTELRLYAELPGFSEEDLEVTLERNRVTIRGRRETRIPDGYVVRRRERGDMEIARTLVLPCRVDPEGIEARLSNGVLEVTIPKAAEERPRRIEVQTS